MKKNITDEGWDVVRAFHMRRSKKDLVEDLLKYKLLFFGSKIYDSMKPLADYSIEQHKQLAYKEVFDKLERIQVKDHRNFFEFLNKMDDIRKDLLKEK